MTANEIQPGNRGHVVSGSDRIYYESWGVGETVVLGHGMGGNHAVWYQQVPVLAAFYHVVTWDQRGFGRSTNVTGSLSVEASVQDLVAVLDALDVERAHLVGQSMGGWAAAGFAVAFSDRARSLILADTIGGFFTPEARVAFDDFRATLAVSPSPDLMALGSHPAVGSQLRTEDLARSFLYSQLGGMTESPSPNAIAEMLGATDYTDRLEGWHTPTLLVVGENDPIFTPTQIWEVANLFEMGEVHVIENTGHSPYFERPEIWNDIVLDFLRRSG